MQNASGNGSGMKQRPAPRFAGGGMKPAGQPAPKAFGVMQKGAPGKAFGVLGGKPSTLKPMQSGKPTGFRTGAPLKTKKSK